MPNFAQTQTIVANQVALSCKRELYGLHKKNDVDWPSLKLKTMVLECIDLNSSTGYYTQAQIDAMLVKISNINLNY